MKIQAFEKLRIFSCILVILVHVSAQLVSSAGVYESAFSFGYFCNVLAFSGVTLFVMISGALTLRDGRNVTVKDTIFKRFLRFFILYMLWKGIYIVFELLCAGELLNGPDLNETLRLSAIKWIGGNAYYHLWYLPMIAFLSLLVPLIYQGVREKAVCRLFIIPFIILCLLVPTAFYFEFPFKYLIMDFLKQCRSEYFPGYLGYFILGHYLYKWKDDFDNKKNIMIYISGLAGLIFAVIFGIIKSRSANTAFEGYTTPMCFTNLLTSSALFILFINGKSSDNKENNNDKNPVKILSGLTLGIYLVHPMIIELLKAFGFFTINAYIYMTVPVSVIIVFALSSLIALILSKLPVRIS